MKLEKNKTLTYAAFGVISVFICGCVSSEKYYKDVTMSREAAYQQWKNQKEQEVKSEVVISGQLSIEDALKLTLVNNKILQSIAQEKEIARGGEIASYSAILPSVLISADYVRKDKVASLGPITFGDVDNYSTSLMVRQPIFAGGAIKGTINAARLFSLLTDQNIRTVVQEVIYLGQNAYYSVLLNQHLMEISTDAVRSSQAHLDSVKQKRLNGVASDFDVVRAEVELSNFQAELIQNKNAINIARANLLKIMGVSQDSDITLSDELVYVPVNFTMEDVVQKAYSSRPDLLTKELDIKYQKELLDISNSRYWPTVSAYYERMRSKPDPHNGTIIDWGNLWSAGVIAAFPIFDGFAREGEVIQQKARLKQSQIRLIDSEETTIFQLNKALLSIQNAVEFVESQKLNLTRATEGLRLAEVGYDEGINTQVEMIDAQSALTEARSNYYQSIYNHIIAKLDLHKAMGTLVVPETGTKEKSENQAAAEVPAVPPQISSADSGTEIISNNTKKDNENFLMN